MRLDGVLVYWSVLKIWSRDSLFYRGNCEVRNILIALNSHSPRRHVGVIQRLHGVTSQQTKCRSKYENPAIRHSIRFATNAILLTNIYFGK